MNCTDGLVTGVVGMVVDSVVAVEHEVGDAIDVDRRLDLERRVGVADHDLVRSGVDRGVDLRIDAGERQRLHAAIEENSSLIRDGGVTASDNTKPLSSIDFTPEVAISSLKSMTPPVCTRFDSITFPVT